MLVAGEIVRIGTPSELIAGTRAEIRYRAGGEEIVVETAEPTRTLHELTAQALADGVELEGLEVRRATLEDVYLELVAEDDSSDALLAPAEVRAADLLAQPRGRVLRLPLPAAALPAARLGLRRRDRRRGSRLDLLLAGLLGYGAANTAFGGLAILLVIRREYGILKRIRSTPLPSPPYLRRAALEPARRRAAALVVVALGVGLFDADAPENWLSFLLALVLGAAAFAGLGLAIAALIRSAEASRRSST